MQLRINEEEWVAYIKLPRVEARLLDTHLQELKNKMKEKGFLQENILVLNEELTFLKFWTNFEQYFTESFKTFVRRKGKKHYDNSKEYLERLLSSENTRKRR